MGTQRKERTMRRQRISEDQVAFAHYNYYADKNLRSYVITKDEAQLLATEYQNFIEDQHYRKLNGHNTTNYFTPLLVLGFAGHHILRKSDNKGGSIIGHFIHQLPESSKYNEVEYYETLGKLMAQDLNLNLNQLAQQGREEAQKTFELMQPEQ